MPSGGTNCCVPGCTNYWAKTGGNLSYVSFPRDTPVNAEWRRKLIARISRADKTFSADRHKICTAHFTKSCLLFHGKGYKLAHGAMPTLNMPSKSVVTPVPDPRKAPRVREPPPVPVRVQYLNFQELCADAKKVKDPWVILRQQEDFLAVGSVDDNLEVAIKVIFQEGSFSPIVKYHNFQLYRHFSVEISGLSSLLNDLNKIVWCNSESRSPTCSVALDSTAKPGNCDACHSFHQKLQEKEARPIKPKTPLSSLREPALIKEVKKCRLQIKELDAELAIKKDIDSESVAVDKKLHAGLLDIIEGSFSQKLSEWGH